MSLLAASIICTPTADAAPSVKRSGSSIEIKEAVDDNAISFVKTEKSQLNKGFAVSVEAITDADLEKLCNAFPDIVSLTIGKGKKLTSLAPVAKLTKLTRFDATGLDQVKDYSVLSGLTGLSELKIDGDGLSGDLKWMTPLANLKKIALNSKSLTSFEGIPSLPSLKTIGIYHAAPVDLTPLVKSLPNLTTLNLNYCTLNDLTPLAQLASLNYLNLYGATVKDFTPLGQCPKLKKVTYYAVKSDNFASLGALKQVTELDGGLTKLADLSWIVDMPNLKIFDVFAEQVTDYSPLARTNIERFTIWNMRQPVGDLGVIGKMPKVKDLKLWSVEGATNSAGLAGLANLETFTITSEFNKKGGEAFDLAATSGWAKVRKIDIQGSEVVNADKLGPLPALQQVSLRKINMKSGTPLSLAGFGKVANIKYMSIYDSTVANFDALAGCTALVRVNLNNVKGITSLDALKKCPNLNQIEIVKCPDIPDAALQGFDPKVKITKK